MKMSPPPLFLSTRTNKIFIGFRDHIPPEYFIQSNGEKRVLHKNASTPWSTKLMFFCFSSHRLSGSVRRGGVAAKRPGGYRPADDGLSLLREPLPDGPARVPGDVLRLLRRLPGRPRARVLLGRLQEPEEDGLQRKRVAPLGWRVESQLEWIQWNHSHRVRLNPPPPPPVRINSMLEKYYSLELKFFFNHPIFMFHYYAGIKGRLKVCWSSKIDCDPITYLISVTPTEVWSSGTPRRARSRCSTSSRRPNSLRREEREASTTKRRIRWPYSWYSSARRAASSPLSELEDTLSCSSSKKLRACPKSWLVSSLWFYHEFIRYLLMVF